MDSNHVERVSEKSGCLIIMHEHKTRRQFRRSVSHCKQMRFMFELLPATGSGCTITDVEEDDCSLHVW